MTLYNKLLTDLIKRTTKEEAERRERLPKLINDLIKRKVKEQTKRLPKIIKRVELGKIKQKYKERRFGMPVIPEKLKKFNENEIRRLIFNSLKKQRKILDRTDVIRKLYEHRMKKLERRALKKQFDVLPFMVKLKRAMGKEKFDDLVDKEIRKEKDVFRGMTTQEMRRTGFPEKTIQDELKRRAEEETEELGLRPPLRRLPEPAPIREPEPEVIFRPPPPVGMEERLRRGVEEAAEMRRERERMELEEIERELEEEEEEERLREIEEEELREIELEEERLREIEALPPAIPRRLPPIAPRVPGIPPFVIPPRLPPIVVRPPARMPEEVRMERELEGEVERIIREMEEAEEERERRGEEMEGFGGNVPGSDREIRKLVLRSIKEQIAALDKTKAIRNLYKHRMKKLERRALKKQFDVRPFMVKLKRAIGKEKFEKLVKDEIRKEKDIFRAMTQQEMRRTGFPADIIEKEMKRRRDEEHEEELEGFGQVPTISVDEEETLFRDVEAEKRREKIEKEERERIKEIAKRKEPERLAVAEEEDFDEDEDKDQIPIPRSAEAERKAKAEQVDIFRIERERRAQLRAIPKSKVVERALIMSGRRPNKYEKFIKVIKKSYPWISDKEALKDVGKGDFKHDSFGEGKSKSKGEASRKAALKNPWVIHLKKVMAGYKKKYPKKSHKAIMAMVKASYKPKKKAKKKKGGQVQIPPGLIAGIGKYKKKRSPQYMKHLKKIKKKYSNLTVEQCKMIANKTYKNPKAMKKIKKLIKGGFFGINE